MSSLVCSRCGKALKAWDELAAKKVNYPGAGHLSQPVSHTFSYLDSEEGIVAFAFRRPNWGKSPSAE